MLVEWAYPGAFWAESGAPTMKMLLLGELKDCALTRVVYVLFLFCSFYYVKSYAQGTGIVRLPVGIV